MTTQTARTRFADKFILEQIVNGSIQTENDLQALVSAISKFLHINNETALNMINEIVNEIK